MRRYHRVFYRAILAATLGVYAAMGLWSLPTLADLSGGLRVFDLRFAYSLADARALLLALGAEGRAFYAGPQHWLDTAFPGLEALALSLTFARLFTRRWAIGLSAVAVAGAVADYLENAAVAGMLRAGPAGLSAEMVADASRWTSLKFICVSLALSALLFGLGRALWRRRAGG